MSNQLGQYNNPFSLGQGGGNGGDFLVGVDPTVRQKLLHYTRKKGIDLGKMQGTTINRYDTELVVDATTPQTLEFFVNRNNKTRQFTNAGNDLKAGESLIIGYIQLELLTLSAGDLSATTSRITNVQPLGQTTPSFPFTSGILTLETANGTRIRDLGLVELNPWLNPCNHGIAQTNLADTGETLQPIVGCNYICLAANPLVLPNNNFQAKLEVGPLNGLPANAAVKMTLGRFGSIYSSNNPL